MADAKVVGKIASDIETIREMIEGSKSSLLMKSISSIATANVAMVEFMQELTDKTKETTQNVTEFVKQSKIENLAKISESKTLNKIVDLLTDIKISTSSMAAKSSLNLKDVGDKKILDKVVSDFKKSPQSSKIMDIINITSALKQVKLKDILFAKKKFKIVTKIYEKFNDFLEKMKKKQNKPEEVVKFVEASVKIFKSLSMMALLAIPAKVGVMAMKFVFLGKFGLISILEKIHKEEKKINKSALLVTKLAAIATGLFIISGMMAMVSLMGMSVITGALLMAGGLLIMGGTVALLGMMDKYIQRGVPSLITLTIGMAIAGLSMILISKGTKDLSWEGLAMVGATLLGFGLLAILFGAIDMSSGLVTVGSISIAILSGAMLVFSVGLFVLGKAMQPKAVKHIVNGLPLLSLAFLAFLPGAIAMGVASPFLVMSGIAMGILYLGLSPWANYKKKSTKNLVNTVKDLDTTFGLGLTNATKGDGIGGQLKGAAMGAIATITGPVQLVGALFQAGSALIKLGIVLMAAVVMRSVYSLLEGCDANIDVVKLLKPITQLDNYFGLGLQQGDPNKKQTTQEKIIQSLENTATGVYDMVSGAIQTGAALLKAGGIFIKLAILSTATGIIGITLKTIKKYQDENYDVVKMLKPITQLDNYFGLGIKQGDATTKKRTVDEKLSQSLENMVVGAYDIIGNAMQLGSALLKAGGVFIKMGILSTAVAIIGVTLKTIKKYQDGNYDVVKMLKPITQLDNYFGLGIKQNNATTKKQSFLEKIVNSVQNIYTGIYDAAAGLVQTGATMLKAGGVFMKLGMLSTAVGILGQVLTIIERYKALALPAEFSLRKIFSVLDYINIYFFQDTRFKTKSKSSQALTTEQGVSVLAGFIAGGPVGACAAYFLTSGGSASDQDRLSLILTSVSIVEKVADVLIKMKDKKLGDMTSAIDSVIKVIDYIIDKFFGPPKNIKDGNGKIIETQNAISLIHDTLQNNKTYSAWSGWSAMDAGDAKSLLEVVVACVSIVHAVAETVEIMSDKETDMTNAIDAVFNVIDKIVEHFFAPADANKQSTLKRIQAGLMAAGSIGAFGRNDLDAEDAASFFELVVQCVGIVSQVSDLIKNLKEEELDKSETNVKKLMGQLDTIVDDILSKAQGEDAAEKFEDMCDGLSGGITQIYKSISSFKDDISKNLENLNKISESLTTFSNINQMNLMSNVGTTNAFLNGLINYDSNMNYDNASMLNNLITNFVSLGNIKNPEIFSSVSKVIDKINSVDIEKATALKETFKSFTGLGSANSFLFGFKKQVSLFTAACVKLVDAINGNTDALTAEAVLEDGGESIDKPTNTNVSITNVKELADLIAKSLTNSMTGGGLGDAMAIELKINGQGGDSWILRRY